MMLESTTSSQPWWQQNLIWLILAGLLGLMVILAAACGAIFLVRISTPSFENTDVYQEALYRARTHPEVIRSLGEPLQVGEPVEGEVQLEGRSGQANLTLPISGSREAGALRVVAVKSSGQWEFTVLEVRLEAQAVPINLLSSIRPTVAPATLVPPPTPVPTQPRPTPMPIFTPTAEVEALALKTFDSQTLRLSMPYPAGWQVRETEEWVIFFPASQNAYPDYPADTAIWVGRPTLGPQSEEGILKEMLAQVTREIEVTGHTTLIVPGHFWSVTEAEFKHQSLGPARASLSLPMGREDYAIFAIAPVEEWRGVQSAVEQIQYDLQYLD